MSVVEQGSPSPTILIVDDEPVNLSVLSKHLQGYGFGIMIARSGETALEQAQSARPDLIVLDVLLPGIDGFETCRRLKANEATQDIPVIFLTILRSTEDRVKGFEVGGVDYIPKPFQHEEALARVTTHLRLRELTERLEQQVAARTHRLEAVATLGSHLNTILDFDQLLTELVNQVKERFDYYHVQIYILDQAGQDLVVAAGYGAAGDKMKAAGHHVPLDTATSLVARAARSGQIAWVDNVHEDPDWVPNPLLPRTCSEMAVPIIPDDRTVGVLDVQSDRVVGLDQGDASLLRSLANQVGVALTNARLFEQALQARLQAEVASQAKSAFLANMSHELRTPLNAILGYAQILRQRLLAPDDINALNTIQQSGEHLLTLIDDILTISKIETGRMELHPTQIHFPDFLKHIAGIIRARADVKGLAFTFERLSTLPTWVQADETRLRQVLLNLLDNAVKFTEQGEVTLTVEALDDAQAGAAEVALRFRVEDTGVGIPPDRLEHIFQPFEQAEDVTRWIEGASLGLAISSQLVGLMGGELRVRSEPGRGSLFWFEVALPATEVAVQVAAPPERDIIRGEEGEAVWVPPPQEELAILHDLALQGDMRGIQERAAHVATLGEQYVPLAKKLRELAQGFEERQILALVEQYVEQDK